MKARSGRPRGLFAALSSEDNLETKVQALAALVGKDMKHDEKSTVKMAVTPENLCEDNETGDEGLTERQSAIGLNTSQLK